MKEYTGKVDQLMSERKEVKEAEKGAAEAFKQQQAAVNSYAMLMPLALTGPAAAPGDGIYVPGVHRRHSAAPGPL